ncbi:hypothetical protein EV361DRAFT_514240 [Lentinula raphanica]|nr:hypothetical protein EV361DRAFT_514240 [Lentinula raphanica]
MRHASCYATLLSESPLMSKILAQLGCAPISTNFKLGGMIYSCSVPLSLLAGSTIPQGHTEPYLSLYNLPFQCQQHSEFFFGRSSPINHTRSFPDGYYRMDRYGHHMVQLSFFLIRNGDEILIWYVGCARPWLNKVTIIMFPSASIQLYMLCQLPTFLSYLAIRPLIIWRKTMAIYNR